MATFSQAITGVPAENSYRPAVLTIDDAFALPGDQQGAMAQGTPFLAKGPDGAQNWYVFDERTIPGVARVLRRL